MTELLLSVHVLAAILAVGSITVAASMFPRYALRGLTDRGQDVRSAGIAALLHRVCRAYALAGLAVPVFGIATAAQLGVLTDAWLITSLALTTIAATLLAAVILPGQRRLLALAGEEAVRTESAQGAPAGQAPSGTAPATEPGRATAMRLTMLTGLFNVLWAVVVVLMIVRPGSTTGA
ncbi:hypothetical protein [Streptomyces fulvorobeus]|uniref:Membrane protein n=1 Tax=Streptomyces fulvorobeus TaxID=284028 RepID=A0A7J0C083_9ACTN|nr:hypothetical protein [Streptomyces fulvorobeus]NYE39150.1 hypothetical protein [Streptomyces fulvorobeus]GFM95353.1 membrane protein [Streptomyces fulvorobeus]